MAERTEKAKLLVVDDTPDNLRVLAGMLSARGYTIRSATSGRMALQYVTEFIPDLIFLDIRMPEMDGYQVCRLLKQDKTTRDIPVIFLSALDDLADKMEAFRAGGVDYITKPFQIEEILARLETQLAVRRLQCQLEQQNAQLQLEIQERQRVETALQILNVELEQRVVERTAQLARANFELRESEATARALLNAPTDAAALITCEGTLLDFNWTTQQLLGNSRHHLLGRCLWDLLPADVAERRAAYVAEVIALGEPVRFEDEYLGRWDDNVLYPVLDDRGAVTKVAVLSRDITERKRAEEALRNAHAHLRVKLDALPDLLMEVDYRGQIYDFHTPRQELILVSPQDVIGRNLNQMVSQATVQTILAAMQEAMETGLHTGALCSLETRLGLRWFELSIATIPYPEGTQDHLIVLARDVTERKWAAEEVSRLVAVVEQATEAILLTNLDGKLVYANPCFEQITGYTLMEVLDKNPWELQSLPEDHETFQQLWNALRNGETGSGDFMSRRKDGSLYYEAITVFPVRIPSGEIINYAAVKRDITEQVRARQERDQLLMRVQEQAQQVQRIMDTVPEGVLLLDVDGRVCLTNPLGREMLELLAGIQVGETLTHLGGRPLAELLLALPKGLWHELESGGAFFQLIARRIEMGVVHQGWVVAIRNVTYQREIEQRIQQQDRLAAVGQLAAGIAHDFNNIMATILLYAQMSSRAEGLSPRDRERLMTVNQQAMHATRLIQQILDFSRSSVLERRLLDLLPLLKEQTKLLERTLPENIRVELDYGTDEYVVNGDPTRMQQVFMNLAVNARDAMPQGGILRFVLERVQIKEPAEAPLPEMLTIGAGMGDWIKVTVVDSGCGIPAEVLPYIYEPFFTTKCVGQGTGLGLSQVHGIIGSHDGFIDVSSRVDYGTTFVIYMPAFSQSSEVVSSADLPDLVRGTGETLLVVEDNSATRQALVDSLEMLNYQILVARNGREALPIWESSQDKVALILSDVVMPEMGGLEMFHVLRQRGNRVPMILLTGHPIQEDLEGLGPLGLAGLLFKPVTLEQLSEAVSLALHRAPE